MRLPRRLAAARAFARVLFLPVVLTVAARAASSDQPAWIAASNANAQILIEATGKIDPEEASRTGAREFDQAITDLTPGCDERSRAILTAARDELTRRLATTTDVSVRQDLEILIDKANKELATSVLEEQLLLPYDDVPILLFFGEFGLLDDQVEAARRPAALVRLKKYLGLAPGTKSILVLAQERYRAKLTNAALLPPFRGEVEKHLAAIPRYAAGIRDLYVKNGLDKADGAPAALDALDAELKTYAEWLRTEVVPHARTDARLPAALYADRLRNVGLDISPEELMAKAKVAFAEIRNEMQTLAPLIAKEHGFASTDYRDVLRELKKAQLTREEVEPYYHDIIRQLEEIIRREKIVSLPARPMRMRLASEAENAAQPAPHFQSPPLIGAKDEQGVFILTTGNPGQGADTAAFDDFTYRAAAWTLTAHEGRPGHDLQFTAMLERGVSLARSLFAHNSVNVEGWALYAEAEAKPYEPLDGQLIALQFRLMRAARAFLDPMLNLGLITRERGFAILTQEVGLSRGMADQELDRYTFRMPGQACAYFYGYSRLMELRVATELALGRDFDRQAFNDFLINQGLLPPRLLAKAVQEQFIPAHQHRP